MTTGTELTAAALRHPPDGGSPPDREGFSQASGAGSTLPGHASARSAVNVS